MPLNNVIGYAVLSPSRPRPRSEGTSVTLRSRFPFLWSSPSPRHLFCLPSVKQGRGIRFMSPALRWRPKPYFARCYSRVYVFALSMSCHVLFPFRTIFPSPCFMCLTSFSFVVLVSECSVTRKTVRILFSLRLSSFFPCEDADTWGTVLVLASWSRDLNFLFISQGLLCCMNSSLG